MANSLNNRIPNCRIRYAESAIFFDFQPGCVNFDYWLAKKVQAERWKQTGEGIRIGCEVTEEEAKYIENIATCQWGPGGIEVIGKPVEAQTKQPIKPIEVSKTNVTEAVQISLF